jgi:hypothetical protein
VRANFEGRVISVTLAALIATVPGLASSLPDADAGSAQAVVTAVPAKGANLPASLQGDDVVVTIGNNPARVLRSEHLSGDMAGVQLFLLLDDSLRSSGLGIQLPELKSFIASLPPAAEVAVGYMRNGMFGQVQPFTTDHAKAAGALRLPIAAPGENGSPYFALSDLAKHWPSQEPAVRRIVLMLTDGVDRYYDNSTVDDPYVDSAIHDAVSKSLIVYSIYIRDTGLYDRGGRTKLFAQSRLGEVTQETGGYAYFQDFTDPVSITPFLNDFRSRLDRQYLLTVEASNVKGGIRPFKVRSEMRGIKIEGPTRVFVR